MTESRERAGEEVPGLDWHDIDAGNPKLDQAPIVWPPELESPSQEDLEDYEACLFASLRGLSNRLEHVN